MNTFLSCVFGTLVSFSALAASQTEVVVPNSSFFVTSLSGEQTFNLNFSRTQSQLGETYQYLITIKNGDGEEHAVIEARDCKDLAHIEKLACLSRRTANLFYVNNIRVHRADIFVNSVQIANRSTFNRDTAVLTLPLDNVSIQNSIQINVAGSLGSYIQVEVTAIISITDQLPPVVTSSLTTGAITRTSDFHILISDQSNTFTEIYSSGSLIKTSTDKDIALELLEGINNFTVKAKDEYGNMAPDFLLENIILDTSPPNINTNLKPGYFFTALPGSVELEFYSMEPLTSLKLDGAEIPYDVNVGYYHLPYTFETEGTHSFSLEAIDLAGNEKVITYSFSAAIDNIAPQITIGEVPLVIIDDSYLLAVEITDENNTSTTVSVDGVESATISEKNFSYLIEFPEDGAKEIMIKTLDGAGNMTVKSVTITKNTGPFIAQVISPLNNTTVNTRLVEIVVSGNKPIQEVTINNVVFPNLANSLISKSAVQLLNDGNFSMPVYIKDIFGETTSAQVSFQISTNSLSSWDYLECHAE